MEYAVIDIGSNSVRFMLTKPGQPLYHKSLATTRIGEGISQANAILSRKAMQRTVEAISKFAATARQHKAQILCFATSAVREAPNRQEFLDMVFSACGITIDVISGETEAKLAYLGATGGHGAVLDIGGGSTEAVYSQGGTVYASSLKIGSVRLLSIDDCQTQLDGTHLLSYADSVLREFCLPAFLPWTGVGGTVTSLSAILLKLKEYDPFQVHGYIINIDSLSKLFYELCSLDYDRRALIPGVSPQRVDTIVTGAAILLAFLRRFNIPSITASEKDGMDGYLINYLKRVD